VIDVQYGKYITIIVFMQYWQHFLRRCLVSLSSHLFCRGVHVLFMLYVFIYVYLYPTRNPDQMIFASFNSSSMGATSKVGSATLPEHISSSRFSGVRIAQTLVFCVLFCVSLLVILFFFFWSLYCQSIFELRLLINPYISSNFSFFWIKWFLLCFLILFLRSLLRHTIYKLYNWCTEYRNSDYSLASVVIISVFRCLSLDWDSGSCCCGLLYCRSLLLNFAI